jgi:hypothetical protein
MEVTMTGQYKRTVTLTLLLLCFGMLQESSAQDKTIVVRRDLLPEVNTSLPAAVDSALRCGLAGLPAAGIALLEQPLQSARGSGTMETLMAGLQASFYSELGMVRRAEDLYTQYGDAILALPYAPYGACLRAALALHHHRMGRREEAFNLIAGSARLAGDVTGTRAIASGRYHLGVIMHWEGADAKALEHFAAAARITQSDPALRADAARYWAAYAAALARDRQFDRASLAYVRAQDFARQDPLARLRLLPAVALARTEMLLEQGRSADAEAQISAAEWPVTSRGTAALHGHGNEVAARLAFAQGNIPGAQRLLREAMVEYLLALADEEEACTLHERDRVAAHLQSVIDMAFSSMLHDSVFVPELSAAAWNAHLALRSLVRAGDLDPLQTAETQNVRKREERWLRLRMENEMSFLPDEPLRRPRSRPRLRTREGSVRIATLQGFAAALPASSRGMVVRRFVDVRGDGAPCYAAAEVSAHAAALPRMRWIDVTGAFEQRVLPAYARSLRAPLALDGVRDWVALTRALPLMQPDARLWRYCGEPLRQAARGDDLVFIPDGMFSAVNPAAVYDGRSGRYLHEDVRLHLLCALPSAACGHTLGEALSARVAVGRPGEEARGMPPAVDAPAVEQGECERFLRAADAAAATGASRSETQLRAALSSGGLVHVDAPVRRSGAAPGMPDNPFLPHARRCQHPAERSGLLAGQDEAFTAAQKRQYAMFDDDDGVLLAGEIGAMDLRNADCVMLSRCGDRPCASLPRDEGRCLLQSFFDAGAPAVVHTLWYMPQQVTREFLAAFRASLDAGSGVEDAFTDARRKLRSRYDHPYFWGSYQLLLAGLEN